MAVGVPEDEVFAAADTVLARGERPTVERESRLLSGLTPAEVDTLIELLGRLHLQVPNVNSYDPSEE